MKRILFALTLLTLVFAAAPRAQAVDVSFDFFYNNISGGSWIEVADYGYCYQPDVVVSNSRWRPYTDGYWAYTDLGWTWVSYEDFGWATYHYGRWVRLADQGWVWAPGRDRDLEWGPAWVSWRTGGDYVGWAPLPPEVTISGRAITGRVDAEFDIGPGYYNFVEVRYIGEPVLRERVVDVSQNVTYIQQTVNVTNITYKDNRVYNYGPDINVINTRATRPIQRLKLETQENVDLNMAAKSGALTKVQGDRLVVAAPMKITKPSQLPPPPRLKAKVQQVKVDKGWSVVADPKVQTELKQKMKTEDASKGQMTAGTPATGQAAAGASPAGSASPMASVSPAGSPGASPLTSPSEAGKRGHKGKPGEKVQPTVGGSPAGSPGAETSQAASPAEFGKGKKGRRGQQFQQGAAGGESPAAAMSPRSESSPASTPLGMERGKKGRRGDMQTTPMESTTGVPVGASQSTIQPGEQGQGKKGRRFESPTGSEPAAGTATEMQSQGGGGKNKGRGQTLAPSGAQPGAPAGEQAQGKGEGKKKAAEGAPSPVPSPQ
jgi:hypothetical protein